MSPRLAVLLAVALAGCTTERATPDTDGPPTALSPVVTTTSVNDGTYGMITQVHWALSPDRRGILVVVDPVGVEAEPVPDGFFFGLEDPTFAIQVDSVWDVAPSPDWRSVAYSKAYVFGFGESEFIPPDQWEAVSRATGIDAATLRASAFPSTGMAYAKAIAQPVVIRVPADPRAQGAEEARPRSYPVARGWRVRWTADGAFLGLGSNPQIIQDDAQSPGWSALDPNSGMFSGSLPAGARLVEPVWVRGPELGIGMPIDVTDAPPITVRVGELNYIIESRRGVVSIRDPAFQTGAAVAVGPGVALAATASGRYVVALRPRQDARENETSFEVVIYTVTL